MKHILKFTIASVFLLFLACEEYEHSPISKDGINPTKIENIILTPINGGFDISYDLPNDNDLLYVKAVYTNSQGEQAEVKTSVFNNKIQILGFGDTEEKTINLYSADRSENISDAVVLKGIPLTPPVFLIQETLEITEDFGGARFSWKNNQKAPVAISLLAPNKLGVLEPVKTQYTEQVNGRVSVRGYDSEPTLFAAVIRDRFDNFSDIIFAKTADKLLTPLFEEKLDKTKFLKVILQNDDNWDAWSGRLYELFDDDMESIVHTQGNQPRPSIITVDLGVNTTLSRFTLYQRIGLTHKAFNSGNPKSYTVYGSKELPGQDGNLDDWILLKKCESKKPSGLPNGTNTDEDMDHFNAGDEFTFDEAIEIRYFRIAVHETWGGSGFVHASEVTFWGSVID